MKKLNRKGFTLVELLAVIVILAIIIALVFPQVTNVLNNSKVSTMHSNAVGVKKWWDTAVIDDQMTTGEKQLPDGIVDSVTTSWKCMDSVVSDAGEKFYEVAKLAESDYVFTGDIPVDGEAVDSNTCSAVRYSNGELEVLLVAKSGGKNYIAGRTTFAFSSASDGNQLP